MATKKYPKYKTKFIYADGSSDIIELDGNKKLTSHFAVWEFANKLANEDVKFLISPKSMIFFDILERQRTQWGVAFDINSGYRTPEFNATLKGADPKSLHLDMLAADVANGKIFSAGSLAIFTQLWKSNCERYHQIGGINYYDSYIHLSIGEEKFGNKEFVIRDKRTKTI